MHKHGILFISCVTIWSVFQNPVTYYYIDWMNNSYIGLDILVYIHVTTYIKVTHDIVQYHLAEYFWQVNRIVTYIQNSYNNIVNDCCFQFISLVYIYNFNFKYIDCMNNIYTTSISSI